jgi:ABC-type branched-subunit amino acid transport system ATPase component
MKLVEKLQIKDVSVQAGGMRILDRISFPVWSGMVTGIIGPNGAGKTTVFNAICGDIRPTSGRILLDGLDITGKGAPQVAALRVGRLFQEVRVFPRLSVLENVLVAVEPEPSPVPFSKLFCLALAKESVAKAFHWLRLFDLAEVSSRLAGELSFGQQKRVAFARLMAADSRVLLLDEPTAGLDPYARQSFLELIRAMLCQSQLTAIVIEHDLDAIRQLTDWTVGLDAGRLKYFGRTQDMLTSETVLQWRGEMWQSYHQF